MRFSEGAGSRIRTDDLLITNQLLYQLSYAGKNAAHINARCRLKQVADRFVVVVWRAKRHNPVRKAVMKDYCRQSASRPLEFGLGLLTRTSTTGSVSLCKADEKLTALLELERVTRESGRVAVIGPWAIS